MTATMMAATSPALRSAARTGITVANRSGRATWAARFSLALGERTNTELRQLLLCHGAGRARQRVEPRLCLGEGDDLADVLLAGQQGDQAVDAEGEPGVG